MKEVLLDPCRRHRGEPCWDKVPVALGFSLRHINFFTALTLGLAAQSIALHPALSSALVVLLPCLPLRHHPWHNPQGLGHPPLFLKAEALGSLW